MEKWKIWHTRAKKWSKFWKIGKLGRLWIKIWLTRVIGMIGTITIWNMKKIGEFLEMRYIMITTFRAFATGVRELKTKVQYQYWSQKRFSMFSHFFGVFFSFEDYWTFFNLWQHIWFPESYFYNALLASYYIGPKVWTILGFSFCIRPKPKSWFRSLVSIVVGQTLLTAEDIWF